MARPWIYRTAVLSARGGYHVVLVATASESKEEMIQRSASKEQSSGNLFFVHFDAVLHKKDHIDETFQSTSWFQIQKDQFEIHQPVKLPYGGMVRWAVVDLTHKSASIPDLSPERIQNMEKLLKLVNDVSHQTASNRPVGGS
jgi:hypothetical protein